MKKVKFNKSGKYGVFHGLRGVIEVSEGQIVDCANDEALLWVDSGVAVFVQEEKEKEQKPVVQEEMPDLVEYQEEYPIEKQEDNKPRKRGRKKKGA